MRLHVGFVYVTDVSFSIVTNVFSRMNVCPSKYPTPKSSKITLRTVVKLNVPLCNYHGLSKRSVILDEEGSKSRRRLLIEKRVRRGYIGAIHRKNVLF